MNLKPLKKRVILVYPKEEQVKGGIILTTKEPPLFGEVVAIGSEVKDVKVGDKVAVAKYAGQRITHDDVEYTIIGEDEIPCTLCE